MLVMAIPVQAAGVPATVAQVPETRLPRPLQNAAQVGYAGDTPRGAVDEPVCHRGLGNLRKIALCDADITQSKRDPDSAEQRLEAIHRARGIHRTRSTARGRPRQAF